MNPKDLATLFISTALGGAMVLGAWLYKRPPEDADVRGTTPPIAQTPLPDVTPPPAPEGKAEPEPASVDPSSDAEPASSELAERLSLKLAEMEARIAELTAAAAERNEDLADLADVAAPATKPARDDANNPDPLELLKQLRPTAGIPVDAGPKPEIASASPDSTLGLPPLPRADVLLASGPGLFPDSAEFGGEPLIEDARAAAVAEAEAESTRTVDSDGRELYSFRTENIDITQALAMFARSNKLNIVPDLDVTGKITVDLHELPLEAMMSAFLDGHGFSWEEKDGLILVHRMETRLFSIDYPRLVRSGNGYSSASLGASGESSGGGSGGGGGGSGGGGSGGSGGGSGGGGGGGTSITQQDNIDFWQELETQLSTIGSADGKILIDKMSGLVQVTDRPRVLNEIATFLEQMNDRVQRQVDIEAKIYEVVLGSQFQLGVDWQMAMNDVGLAGGLPGTDGAPNLLLKSNQVVRTPTGGITPINPAVVARFGYQNPYVKVAATLEALKNQGELRSVSQPRIRSLNNQMAVIKVGTDRPFFDSSSGFVAGNGGSPGGTFENSSFKLITVGTILSITPQISDDGEITLDISPVITSLVGIESSQNGLTTAPILDVKQSSSLIRVQDGETIIIGGLIQDKTTSTKRAIPLLGDVPLLGKAFRGMTESTQKTELIIFLTPKIVD